MYKSIFIYINIVLFSAVAFAQETYTLDKAVTYAMDHSPVLNINKLKLQEASIQVDESKLQYVPDIYLSGDLRRNLIIPATPVPANVFDPSASEGELMYLKFNTKWNSSAGLNMKYDLFNPEKVNSVAKQQHQLRIQEYDTEMSEAELKEKVALAYADCIIAEEQVKLLKDDVVYFEELLDNANQLFKKEQISLSEKNDANRAYNESVSKFLEAEKIAGDRKAELLYLIGKDVTSENIESLFLEEDIPSLLEKVEQKKTSKNILNDLEVLRQQEVTNLASLKVKSAQLKYAPTLSLNGYLGSNYYNNDFSLFNNNHWRGNSYIGLSVMLPISRSLNTTKEVSRLRLQQQMETENLRDIRNKQEKERLNNLSLLQVRQKNYQLSRDSWEMSLQNSKAVQLQYEKGYIRQSDLLNEQQKAGQYRHNFLQAAYDLFNILITMD
ncbi:MAG: TolC family protein [Lascolabacillus sp.]|jgi:outer membrane protein|uniref:TolC family protein n=1 Tax=Lascolabacillus sp. TaxID=1924068 RepID=UPI00120A3B32|nr:TolC family protein [Lascolabacillus sp.]MBP7104089.1 TolC family protein [Fermentimonas sp.]MDD3657609.1 TolC family protein [Lascolabacillus sp.]MDI9626616.1 TolC family protein [Bacteroidota bacterium]TAH62109.1 MAG: TolC family protein [Fermentimonas caenicola]